MKIIQILYYFAAAIAALGALYQYWKNSRREQAKWAVQLYEKFYEAERYKLIREKLDCAPNASEVVQLVAEESTDFTDYLNFFEMVCFLADSKQISKEVVLSLFRYYLCCLTKHNAVMKYLNDNDKSFEQLREFLRNNNLKSTCA